MNENKGKRITFLVKIFFSNEDCSVDQKETCNVHVSLSYSIEVSSRIEASIHPRFLVSTPRAKYMFAERARAHNRTIHSKRGGYLSLSLSPRSLSHRSCPLRLSNDALLPVSAYPYLPSDSRNLSTLNTRFPSQ